MHELVHILCAYHEPTKNRKFRKEFGAGQPDNYDKITWVSTLPLFCRPKGYATVYGKLGGGEEHFAELVAYMYTRKEAFLAEPPEDLVKAWDIAWNNGLKLMV